MSERPSSPTSSLSQQAQPMRTRVKKRANSSVSFEEQPSSPTPSINLQSTWGHSNGSINSPTSANTASPLEEEAPAIVVPVTNARTWPLATTATTISTNTRNDLGSNESLSASPTRTNFHSLGKKTPSPTVYKTSPAQSLETLSTKDKLYETRSIHSYDASETVACAETINNLLHPEQDPELMHLLPDEKPLTSLSAGPELDQALFHACKDGWLLAKLINAFFPDTIDTRQLKRAPKMKIQATQNVQLMLNGARSIGVRLNNIGPEDIWAGTPQLCLGLLWQIIKNGLLAKVSLHALHNSEMREILRTAEDVISSSRPSSPTAPRNEPSHEKLLLKWVNYHLRGEGSQRKLTNFTIDLRDGEIYAILMHRLGQHLEESARQGLDRLYGQFENTSLQELDARGELVAAMAEQMGMKGLLSKEGMANGNRDHAITFLAQLLDKVLSGDSMSTTRKSQDVPKIVFENSPQASRRHPNSHQDKREDEEEKRERDRLQASLRQAEAEKSVMQKQIDALRSAHAKLQQQTESLTVTAAAAAAKKTNERRGESGDQDVSLEIRVRESKIQSLTDEVRKLKHDAEYHHSERQVLKSQNERLQQEVITERLKSDELVSEVEDLRESTESYHSERDRLVEQVRELKEELQDWKTKLQSKDHDALQMTETVSALEQETQGLENELEMITKERSTLEKIIIEAYRNVQDLLQMPMPEGIDGLPKVTLPSIAPHSERPNRDVHVIPQEVHSLNDLIQCLQQHYGNILAKAKHLHGDKVSLTAMTHELQSTLENQGRALKTMEMELNQVRAVELPQRVTAIERLEATVKSRDAEIAKYQGLTKGLNLEKEKWSNTEKLLHEAREAEVAMLKSQIGVLEKELLARVSDINHWKSTVDVMRNDYHRQRGAVMAAEDHGLSQPRAERLEKAIEQLKLDMQRQARARHESGIRSHEASWLEQSNEYGLYGVQRRLDSVNSTLRGSRRS